MAGSTASCGSTSRTPWQPTSSSYEASTCTGVRSVAGSIERNATSTAAKKPFMSAVPRPYSRSSTAVRVNGSVRQPSPGGTTSVCPDSMRPPGTAGPREATRLALPACAPGTTCTRAPHASSCSLNHSCNAVFGVRLTVGNATRLRSKSTTCGITADASFIAPAPSGGNYCGDDG